MAITHVGGGYGCGPTCSCLCAVSLPHGLQVGSFFVRPKADRSVEDLAQWDSEELAGRDPNSSSPASLQPDQATRSGPGSTGRTCGARPMPARTSWNGTERRTARTRGKLPATV